MKPTLSATALKSMTGYAQARLERDAWLLRVSVRSVNHRFLDLRVRLPEGFESFEPQIRQLVRDRLRRGHVEVTLHLETVQGPAARVNREVAGAYLSAITELRREFALAPDADLVGLLRLPGVIGGLAPSLPETEEEQEVLGQALEKCLREALGKMDEMRIIEGRHLVEELRARVGTIKENCNQVRALVVTLRPAFTRRLEVRLKELLNGTNIEPARLAQEAALLAERSDISEELDRLRSHLQQFTKLLDGAGELGKKLDFLLQEMHREANTMLSKTPGVESEALAITGLSLEIKSEIEKLREQVQNLE